VHPPRGNESGFHLLGIVAGILVDAEFLRQDPGDVACPVEDAKDLDTTRDGSIEDNVLGESGDGEATQVSQRWMTVAISVERRKAPFEVLTNAQAQVLNLTLWHQFLTTLIGAGFRSGAMISSQIKRSYVHYFCLPSVALPAWALATRRNPAESDVQRADAATGEAANLPS
jgi:hypothetical protein